jgi:predicted alpha-1,2-mannosidase
MVLLMDNLIKKYAAAACITLFLLSSCSSDKLKYVDPFIGTDYTGHTFPAASCPLGMVQPGPDTGNYLWKYCSGYNYSDSLIIGFSQNRLNGTGVPSLCNILIMPFSDTCGPDFSSRKAEEKASPGYYSVALPDNGATVEISCSPRVACYSINFKGSGGKLFINLQNIQITDHSDKPSMRKGIRAWEGGMEDAQTLKGHIAARSWVKYDLWYEIKFNRPVQKVDTLCLDSAYVAPAYVLDFGEDTKTLKAKISLSYTSAEGAHANMSEVQGWNFSKVRKAAEKSWNEFLSLIDIDAPDSVKTAFYTSMYHLYLQPNVISDKGEKIKYSTFSQWDTYRAADPLRTILTPDIEADIVNNMIDAAEERGHLPVWDLCGKDNYCMIANHAVPTVVGACLKGLPGVDSRRAYTAVKNSLTVNHKKSDWDIYDKYGYYPFDLVKVESVSRTLESCYDDWCAAQLAKALGEEEDYKFFIERSKNYRNLFDPSVGFFRGKDSKGNWREPFESYRYSHAHLLGGDYTEGNAWHYLWHIQHDPFDLMELLGGKEKFVEKLDTLFNVSVPPEITGEASDVTGLIGQYSHGNEPCHHVIYLYTLAGRQDKAAERIRQVFERFYLNEPGGLCGNDDCGQMSAWYIYSALGYYPVNPVSGELVEGKKQVRKAVIKNNLGQRIKLQ